jgi:hypothetical protein
MLDLGSFLELHFGVDPAVRTPLALVAGVIIGAVTFLAFRRGEDRLLHRFLLPVSALYVLLFSYLSESPTSVLATAGIFLIGARALEAPGSERRYYWLAWGLGIALVGLGYSDIPPAGARAWAREFHLKTVGYLYVLAVNLLLAWRLHRASGAGAPLSPVAPATPAPRSQ